MPPDDLALIAEAARMGGEVAMRHFRRDVARWEKPGGAGPVSEADLAVNAALRERLMAARPGYGWLSEEDADTPARLGAGPVFVVDPIDGTRAFLEGREGFSISVAVVVAGRPVAGAVHLPALGRSYAAASGRGATRDGRAVAPAEVPLAGARVLMPKGQLRPEHWPGGVPAVEPQVRSSLAWRLCLVAEGAFDALVTLRDAHEWDVAAGVLIAAEAGAAVTDCDGGALVFNGPEARVAGVIAAAPGLHAALMARRRGGGGGAGHN